MRSLIGERPICDIDRLVVPALLRGEQDELRHHALPTWGVFVLEQLMR
jgi:hypothetical protein